MANRSKDWLLQAAEELRWAENAQEDTHYSLACFLSQQAAEKALKAVCYARAATLVKTHSVTEIVKSLGLNGEIEDAGRRLDQYYISTRCPDAFFSGPAFTYFTKDQGHEAVTLATLILNRARAEIADGS